MQVYPGMFAAAAMASCVANLGGYYETWTDGVREAEFLREVRLQNLELDPPSTDPQDLGDSPRTTPPEQGPEVIVAFPHAEMESEEDED
jgi:hypothetical protein